uniref:Reverse transcriptase domain-containing protein n=1 Tax=Dendroctonus ponderosae TaxID=77166 RepID=A0AAR5Q9X0_DENPD
MNIATYNIRSIATEDRTEELEAEIGKIIWDVIGISHKLYYKERENSSPGGEGILIHKRLPDNVRMLKAIFEKVIYVTIQINKQETLKIIQECATIYCHHNITSQVLVIGDFNCKIGGQADPGEKYVGKHGLGKRNPRGSMMVDFLEEEHLYNANTLFQKNPNRKWTWASPDRRTFNQIDYILTKNIQIVQNVENGTRILRRPIRDESTDISEQDQEVKLTNVNSEDIPEITEDEIRSALHHIKNGKAAGEEGILTEMLTQGGDILVEQLEILFNKCLENEDIPQDWTNALVIIIHKKGDTENLENYRHISLLSKIYKLFSKIITTRLTPKLDHYHPKEQARFRKGYSTTEYLQTMRTLIEKAKGFRHSGNMGTTGISLINNIYRNATLQIQLHKQSDKVAINREVRQGDPLSPKLFTLVLEDALKKIDLQDRGININGEKLNHLMFAGDIVVVAESREELVTLIEDIYRATKRRGL